MSNATITLLLMALFGTARHARTQEVRATIGGRVTDTQRAVVSNAAVVVVSDETSVKQQTLTNDQGNWAMQFLLPGHYHFSVSAPGFKTSLREGITLQAADNKQFDYTDGSRRHQPVGRGLG
jgi:hypothetical protein